MFLSQDFIDGLSEYLAEACSIEEDTVRESIEEYVKECCKMESKSSTSPKKVVKSKTTVKSNSKATTKSNAKATTTKSKATSKGKAATNTCEYVFGPRSKDKAGEMCGKIAKIEIDGKWYCGTEKTNDDGEVLYTLHARSAQLSTKKAVKSVVRTKKASTGLDAAKEKADSKSKEYIQTILKKKGATIRKNHWGNFEHVATGLVIDRKTNRVLGHQEKDGTLGPLTDEHVDVCEANNWDYDASNTLASLKENEDDEGDDDIEEDVVLDVEEDDNEEEDDDEEEE